jgi:hypothetical protein
MRLGELFHPEQVRLHTDARPVRIPPLSWARIA